MDINLVLNPLRKQGAEVQELGINNDPNSQYRGKRVVRVTWTTAQWQGGTAANVSRVTGATEEEIAPLIKDSLYNGRAFVIEFAVDP